MDASEIGKITAETMRSTLSVTALLVIVLLGPTLTMAAVMHLLNRALVGRLGYRTHVYVSGWLGTPVHELGHALVALLFGFRITALKLWTPGSQDGTLGRTQVSAPNGGGLRRSVGSFFIGIGPLILGAILISLASRFCLNQQLPSVSIPIYSMHPGCLHLTGALWQEPLAAALALLHAVVRHPGSWHLYAFLYFAFCIGSHMTLSRPDITYVIRGFPVLLLILLAVNAVAYHYGGIPVAWVRWCVQQMGVLNAALMLALLLDSTLLAAVWIARLLSAGLLHAHA